MSKDKKSQAVKEAQAFAKSRAKRGGAEWAEPMATVCGALLTLMAQAVAPSPPREEPAPAERKPKKAAKKKASFATKSDVPY